MLDVNQIGAGAVRADIVIFPDNDLLSRLQREFAYQAEAKNIELRVSSCKYCISGNPRLFEQMIRNPLGSAAVAQASETAK